MPGNGKLEGYFIVMLHYQKGITLMVTFSSSDSWGILKMSLMKHVAYGQEYAGAYQLLMTTGR